MLLVRILRYPLTNTQSRWFVSRETDASMSQMRRSMTCVSLVMGSRQTFESSVSTRSWYALLGHSPLQLSPVCIERIEIEARMCVSAADRLAIKNGQAMIRDLRLIIVSFPDIVIPISHKNNTKMLILSFDKFNFLINHSRSKNRSTLNSIYVHLFVRGGS